MEIGNRIRDSRKRAGLTQKELAKKLNLSAQVVSNWERNYTNPIYEDISNLSNILNVSADYLVGKTEDPSISVEKLMNEIPERLRNSILRDTKIEEISQYYLEGYVTGYLIARYEISFILSTSLDDVNKLYKKLFGVALLSEIPEEYQKLEYFVDKDKFQDMLDDIVDINFKSKLINIVDEYIENIGSGKPNPDEQTYGEDEFEKVENTSLIPVLGHIAAGQPIFADEHIIDYTSLPSTVAKQDASNYFMLVVKGDSMTGSRIFEGDKVLVRKQDTVENGEIAVVNVNGYDATLKKVKKYDDGSVWLYSTNEKYAPIPLNDSHARIIGKVVQVIFVP